MRTFYIQGFLKGRWVTILKTDTVQSAEYIAYELAEKFSVRTRIMSKTKLIRKQGVVGPQQAEQSILNIKNDPAYKDIIEYAEQTKKSYEDSIDEEKTQERTIDYLLRDIPESLHLKMKGKAFKQNLSLRSFILKACQDAVQ